MSWTKLPSLLRKGFNPMNCVICDKPATWVRSTQFAGDHPYCDLHAKQESDFNENDSYTYWKQMHPSELDEKGYKLGTELGQLRAWAQRLGIPSNQVPLAQTEPPSPVVKQSNSEYFNNLAIRHRDKYLFYIQLANYWSNQWQNKIY